MAQKIKPNAYRIGVTLPWASRWFPTRQSKFFLEEDYIIRNIVKKRILVAGIASIEIERTGDAVRVIIKAARPGLIIGRGGKGIEELKNELTDEIKTLRKKNKKEGRFTLNVTIEELKRFEISAQVLAQQVAFDIEKRLPFRRVMKRTLETIIQTRGVQGAKIKLSGRLGGAEIARTEQLAKGKMSLQSLRANVDYGEATAFNTYGTVGIKLWIYKGEIFKDNEKGQT